VKRRGKRKLIWIAGLAALVVAAPASAAVRISGVDTSSYPELRLTVVAPVGDAAPRLREDGAPVAGASVANLGHEKSVVLAVDRSDSMRGAKLAAAKAAAQAFVDAKSATDRIQVVAFGHSALALTKFSNSGADADAALGGLAVDPFHGTALWDAVVRSAAALSNEQDQPGHVILVVTDGRDVSSSHTLDEAVAAAQRARAAVYAIGIAGKGFTPAPLRVLAQRTGGVYLQASSSRQLDQLYRQINAALAHTWQVRYVTAARPGEQVQITAAVPGNGSASRGVALAVAGLDRVPGATAPSVLPRGAWRSGVAPAVLAGIVGALVLLAMLFVNAARSGSWLNARLAPHLAQTQRKGRAKQRQATPSLRKTVVTATEQAFSNVKQFRWLQQLITRADLPLLAAELLYICLGAGVLLALFAALIGAAPVFVLVFLAGGAAAPIGWVALRAQKRIKAFDNQLADLLISIAASLKAGHSFRHAIQAIVEEGADPAAKEFRRVLTETRLGRPMDEALAEMGERVGSKNLIFVLNAVTIQRQIGGTLAGLFDMVAETVRQRQQFARKIRSLTAMGRMSAYTLGGLPFAVAFLITLISPKYMSPLWHSTTGHELVGFSLVMLGFGGVILRKIVSFKG
jgi:tight adherence protein B